MSNRLSLFWYFLSDFIQIYAIRLKPNNNILKIGFH